MINVLAKLKYSQTSVFERFGVRTIRFSNKNLEIKTIWFNRALNVHAVLKKAFDTLCTRIVRPKRGQRPFFWRPPCSRAVLGQSKEGAHDKADAGYCKVLSTDLRPILIGKNSRVIMMVSKNEKRSRPSCRMENASAQAVKDSFQHQVYIQTSISLWYRLISPIIYSKAALFELGDLAKPRFDCILLMC